MEKEREREREVQVLAALHEAGWKKHRKEWKVSLPLFLFIYLLTGVVVPINIVV